MGKTYILRITLIKMESGYPRKQNKVFYKMDNSGACLAYGLHVRKAPLCWNIDSRHACKIVFYLSLRNLSSNIMCAHPVNNSRNII